MAYETITTIANAAARPTPSDGMIRYQQDIQSCIVYDDGASAWKVFTPDAAPYDLDGTNIMSVTPSWHFDASLVNGTDATGNPSNAAAFTGVWTSRTNGLVTFANPTSAKQPTFYTSGTNSKPYLNFDGGDHLAVSPFSDYFTGEDDFTWFCVGSKDAGSVNYSPNLFHLNYTVWFNYINGQDYLFYGAVGASLPQARPTFASGVGNGSTALCDYTVTRMFLVTRDSSDNGDLFVDGDNQNTALASTTSLDVIPQYGGTVGSLPVYYTNGIGRTGYVTTGKIYELAFFNSDLSTADRNKLIAYVNTKYGGGRNADDSDDLARADF